MDSKLCFSNSCLGQAVLFPWHRACFVVRRETLITENVMKKKFLILVGLVFITSFGFADEGAKESRKHHKNKDFSKLEKRLKEEGHSEEEIKKIVADKKAEREAFCEKLKTMSPEEKKAAIAEHKKERLEKFKAKMAEKGMSEEEINAAVEKRKSHKGDRRAEFKDMSPEERKAKHEEFKNKMIEKMKEKGLSEEEIQEKLKKMSEKHGDRKEKHEEFKKLSPEEREAKARERMKEKGLSDSEIDEKIKAFKEKHAEKNNKE